MSPSFLFFFSSCLRVTSSTHKWEKQTYVAALAYSCQPTARESIFEREVVHRYTAGSCWSGKFRQFTNCCPMARDQSNGWPQTIRRERYAGSRPLLISWPSSSREARVLVLRHFNFQFLFLPPPPFTIQSFYLFAFQRKISTQRQKCRPEIQIWEREMQRECEFYELWLFNSRLLKIPPRRGHRWPT